MRSATAGRRAAALVHERSQTGACQTQRRREADQQGRDTSAMSAKPAMRTSMNGT
jgi:hypothetical protein